MDPSHSQGDVPPQQQHQHQHQHPPAHAHLPSLATAPMRTSHSTPLTSPGLFSPTGSRYNLANTSISETSTPFPSGHSPYLHPLQSHRVRETHKANIDSDEITGRKLINQYEVIEELGRGVHGKVKLARNLENGDNVAIKIIPRFSKKRRLGKVTAMSQQDKTKKEIAILKKIRHPNVVALLEVIDDPELMKIYMVLEHVELGEIVWRKKGLPHICMYERRRIEQQMRGEAPTDEEQRYNQLLERRQAIKDLKRAKMAQQYAGPLDYWSVEHGAADDISSSLGRPSRVQSSDDFAIADDMPSGSDSHHSSQAPSRSISYASVNNRNDEQEGHFDFEADEDDLETPGPLSSTNSDPPAAALAGTMYGAYSDDNKDAKDNTNRGRSASMADSIISHMSSVDFNEHQHDAFTDDFSYVPCFTWEQARSTFRDTVLGLEYLHYQGVVHRDIKPANLLWTKDHRVKISDFGVSYFGRPIRDGDQDEKVTESEAKDFDDDRELAKTVGTPAFFAPELCFTDLDKEPPKVTEQIDVWSLGVTLFCLIFARIPFLAEDEFQMFKKIATEEVCIPRTRLKPVDPTTSPPTMSLYKRHNAQPYRDDNDLEYEDVDPLLADLLRVMLVKNPENRIRLRDIKRHPWVVAGIANPIGWLDDTDPARPSSGRRIQVDERDMSAAVVPLTFLERARSVMKKAVGKVMHPLVERGDSRSRRRATSSAASSAGDSMFNTGPHTPQNRSDRRRSVRPDDYFSDAIAEPSANAATADAGYDPLATVMHSAEAMGRAGDGDDSQQNSASSSHDDIHSRLARAFHRQGLSSGKPSHRFSHIGPHTMANEARTTPATPCFDGSNEDLLGVDIEGLSRARGMESTNDDDTRSRSVDRGLFVSPDKRAQPHVGVSTAIAPGSVQNHRHPRAKKSVDLAKGKYGPAVASPLSSSPQRAVSRHRHGQPHSDPDFEGNYLPLVEDRPNTAHRVENIPVVSSPGPMESDAATTGAFPEAKKVLSLQTTSAQEGTKSSVAPLAAPKPELDTVHASDQYPPDVGDDSRSCPPSRGNTMATEKSSSTESIAALGTPLTSPSETTSPVSSFLPGKHASERMPVFQSDPSLPALLSGASSVSADLEGEYLGRPGVVHTRPPPLDTSNTLTPPILMKEPSDGFPLEDVLEHPQSSADREYDHSDSTEVEADSARSLRKSDDCDDDDDDDDDGSDDGFLVMAKSRKKSALAAGQRRSHRFEAKRRDTNASTASDETAKRVPVHDDASQSTEP